MSLLSLRAGLPGRGIKAWVAGEGTSWQGTPGPALHLHTAQTQFFGICKAAVLFRSLRQGWSGVIRCGLVHCQAPGLAASPPGEEAQARLANGSLPGGERTGDFIYLQGLSQLGQEAEGALCWGTWQA